MTRGPDGAFAALGKGARFVDHTPASADIARELFAAATERGFGFLDAPVSGGQAGAVVAIARIPVFAAHEMLATDLPRRFDLALLRIAT